MLKVDNPCLLMPWCLPHRSHRTQAGGSSTQGTTSTNSFSNNVMQGVARTASQSDTSSTSNTNTNTQGNSATVGTSVSVDAGPVGSTSTAAVLVLGTDSLYIMALGGASSRLRPRRHLGESLPQTRRYSRPPWN